MKIAKALEMQQLDRVAIEKYGIPGIVLMENAGQGTVTFMENVLGNLTDTTVVLFIGPGNNGGDGLVMARRIHQLGGHPLLLFSRPPSQMTGDAAKNATIVEALDLFHLTWSEPFDREAIVQRICTQHMEYPVICLVDALFGTGLTRAVRGHMEQMISLINALHEKYKWPVVSVDLPSGRDADTGAILGCAVEADITVTYGLPKPAHYHHGGAGIGRLHIVDIGIPAAAIRQAALPGASLTGSIAKKLPYRLLDGHKGSHGHLLVLAGSSGKTGAAILCCQGALQSGCGLVTAVVPHNLNPTFEQCLIEAMTIPLPRSFDTVTVDDLAEIYTAAENKTAVVLGPGLGTDEKTRPLVLQLYQELSLPMVVDADGLNILAEHPDILDSPGGPRILTPHPGEMARLTGQSTLAIQEDRITAALSLCRHSTKDVVIVLKGAGTVIAHNRSGLWSINTSGNAGMASGGMGDVLAGLIGSLLAQSLSPWDAAREGVYLHGLAADQLSGKKKYGYLASDVASQLPEAIEKCSTSTRGGL